MSTTTEDYSSSTGMSFTKSKIRKYISQISAQELKVLNIAKNI